MTRFHFILPSADRERFLQEIESLGVVDMTRSSKAVDSQSERLMEEAEEIRHRIAETKSQSDARMEELKERASALEKELEESLPWGEFDREKLLGLGLDVKFYSISRKALEGGIPDNYATEVISMHDGKVFLVVIGESEGFPYKEITPPQRTPDSIRKDIRENREEICKYSAVLSEKLSEIPAMEEELSLKKKELSRYLAAAGSGNAAEGVISVFEGFAPTKDADGLCAALDRMDLVYIREKASVEDNPPIEFHNNRFVRMFEPLTDMYGRPAYNGFDPTGFISVFFLLFFAMCMGDAGYGIILIIAGLLLGKVRSFASLSPLVTTLGAGTFVVGFLFHTFFSMDMASWEWIPACLKKIMVPSKIAGYDGTMILALAVGVVHLCLAMLVKAVYAVRNNGFANSLGTLGWTLLLVGAAVTGAAALAGVLDKEVTRITIIILGCISAIGIFFLNDIHRNPLKNIGSGLWETYNTATGVLGDVLSYLRLYALGLAGSMLGFAFNNLAEMALGDGGIRWIFFILIVIIGHTLNLAMAALGAFVHPLRLNFLEFFKNSGYEAAGRRYNPLK